MNDGERCLLSAVVEIKKIAPASGTIIVSQNYNRRKSAKKNYALIVSTAMSLTFVR